MDLERIAEMEKRLNAVAEATAGLDAELDRIESLLDDMSRLFEYYGSNEWFDDLEGELPADVPAGVLSEDQVYAQFMKVREASFRMLELGTEILKDRL